MPFPGVTLNPTENVYVLESEDDIPDELSPYVFYVTPSGISISIDGTNIIKISTIPDTESLAYFMGW